MNQNQTVNMMNKCKHCELARFKDSKDRPYIYMVCEFNYYKEQLKSDLLNFDIADGIKDILDFITRIINKINGGHK